jgi:hypothetical protein
MRPRLVRCSRRCPRELWPACLDIERGSSERATGRQHRSAWRGTHPEAAFAAASRVPAPARRPDHRVAAVPARQAVAGAGRRRGDRLVGPDRQRWACGVRGGPDAAATIATVEHALAGVAVIRTVQGPMLRWRRVGRWHRWAMEDGEVALLRFVAAHGLLRSSVRDHGPTGHPRADRGAALLDRRVPRAPSLAHRDRWRGRGRRDRGGWSGIAQQVNDLTALPSRGSPSDREEQEPTSCSGGRLRGGEDHRAEPAPICTQRSSLLPHPPTASARGLITSTF